MLATFNANASRMAIKVGGQLQTFAGPNTSGDDYREQAWLLDWG